MMVCLMMLLLPSQRETNRFWQLRDGVIDILNEVKYRANFDIGVPISQMASFVHL